MLGFIFSLLAGAFMSFQGVFNTKLSEHIGLLETNTIVQGTGFVLTLIIMLIFGRGDIMEFRNANKLYLTGGLLGFLIIFLVMKGMSSLGPTYAVAVILVAQLVTAALIEALGLFGFDRNAFSLREVIGVLLMICGIIVFKFKFF